MITIGLFHVAAFGLAYIVGYSKISFPLRALLLGDGTTIGRLFVALLECAACFGFWEGFAARALEFDPYPEASGIVVALATCSVNLFLARWSGISEGG